MLEQGEERYRRRAVERRRGRKPRENSGRCVGKRVAAGILRRDVPALQSGEHAAAERAIRRN